jgi:hypothetical protein
MIEEGIVYLLVFAGWGTLLVCGGLAVDRWEKRND